MAVRVGDTSWRHECLQFAATTLISPVCLYFGSNTFHFVGCCVNMIDLPSLLERKAADNPYFLRHNVSHVYFMIWYVL